MSKVLVITGTPSIAEKSYSIAIVNEYVKQYQTLHPEDEIIKLDLNNEAMASKTLTSKNMSTYWNDDDAIKYINQLKEVNKVIIASPMNNFAVSAMIKNYLDHILLANQTFSYKYSKKGDAKGLLDHLKVQIITTQGAPLGWYPFGDHTAYLKGTWEFVGAQVTTPIVFAGTKIAPLMDANPIEGIKSVHAEIEKAVKDF